MWWTVLLVLGVLLLSLAALMQLGIPAALAVAGVGCIYAAIDGTRTEVPRG